MRVYIYAIGMKIGLAAGNGIDCTDVLVSQLLLEIWTICRNMSFGLVAA